MNKRVLGVLGSLLMAALGTFIVLSYVSNADERAIAGQESVEVLVAREGIEKGSSAAELDGKVEAVLVPAVSQAEGSVESLDELGESFAAVDLVPGEQIVSARFVQQDALEERETIDIPAGYLQVTVSLTPERALGGALRPGDMVAYVASFEPFEFGSIEPGELIDSFDPVLDERFEDKKTPNTSHIILHKALVTNVQIEQLPAESIREDAEQLSVQLAPTGNLLVTLALQAPDVEKAVFTAEHGSVWLAWEPDDASEAGTRIQHRGVIYR